MQSILCECKLDLCRYIYIFHVTLHTSHLNLLMLTLNKIKNILPQRFGYSVVGVRGSIVPAPPASISREGLYIALIDDFWMNSHIGFRWVIFCILLEGDERAWEINLKQESISMIRNYSTNKHNFTHKSKNFINSAEDANNLSLL